MYSPFTKGFASYFFETYTIWSLEASSSESNGSEQDNEIIVKHHSCQLVGLAAMETNSVSLFLGIAKQMFPQLLLQGEVEFKRFL